MNADELTAMDGLPHLQRVLYPVIRKHMDIETGIVGIKRGISWQGLSEEVYIEPAPGIKSQKFSRAQLKRAGAGLEKAGLLKPMSVVNRDEKRLIFKCLLATTDKSSQEKAVRKPSVEPVRLKASNGAVSGGKAVRSKSSKAVPPPRIGDISISSSSSNTQPDVDDDNDDLIYSEKLTPQQRNAIKRLLKGLDAGQAQLLLDELAGQMSTKPIASPIGYMRPMINQVKAGTWIPTMAYTVQEGRKRQQKIAAQAERSKAAAIGKEVTPIANGPKYQPKTSLREALKKGGEAS